VNVNLLILRLKKLITYGTALLLLLLILLQSERAIIAVQNTLVLCYKTVIPSLFPFFVLSGILTAGSFIKTVAKWLSPIMKPIFGISGAGALPFVIGIVSGYPMGASVCAELYRSGAITRREAMRLLPFSNNSGPLFIIGAVGTAMLGDPHVGVVLYGVHIACAILVGICFRFYHGAERHYERMPTKKITSAVSFSQIMANSVSTMLLVCGFIIFFAVITACIMPMINSLFPKSLSLLVNSILEVTNGAFTIVHAPLSPRLMLSFLSAAIGFGGICVMMQVSGIITPVGLSVKTYAVGKALHGLLSGIMCYLVYPFASIDVAPAFAVIPPISPAADLTSLVILLSVAVCLCLIIPHKKQGKTAKN